MRHGTIFTLKLDMAIKENVSNRCDITPVKFSLADTNMLNIKRQKKKCTLPYYGVYHRAFWMPSYHLELLIQKRLSAKFMFLYTGNK